MIHSQYTKFYDGTDLSFHSTMLPSNINELFYTLMS